MEDKDFDNHQRNKKFQVLVDSDAFVGIIFPDDAHHQSASQTFQWLKQRGYSLVTTSLVVVETATVLSYRQGQELARRFLDEVIEYGGFPVIHIDDGLQKEAVTIFKNQSRRGTSMIDCSNVAVIRRFNIPRIFSFDKVYTKDFGLEAVN